MQSTIESAKTGAIIAGATISGGVGSLFGWIPDDIGKLTALVGLILSLILIAVHVVILRKKTLELKILKEEYEKKQQLT